MKIILPEDVKKILYRLAIHGHDAYVVGGCVRDSLMGVTPHDWDICTSALPEETKEIFSHFRLIETGLKHGTVTVVVNGVPYEITTFRIDGTYSDGRHPDSVSFTKDIEADLSRRDFTMNAMAYNDEAGLIDPFGGREDIENFVIRCVGDPHARFQEDPLRILRAMRFESTLGFTIAYDTQDAMDLLAHKLSRVSAERVRDELCKMLMGPNIKDTLLNHPYILPTSGWLFEMKRCIGFQQNNRWHQYDVYEHIVRAVDAYKGDDLVIRLALLFHDIGKPDCYTENETGGHFYGHPTVSAKITNEIMQRLKFDNKTRHDVVELVAEHDRTFSPTPKCARKLLNQLGETQTRRLMRVREADILGQRMDHSPDRLVNLDNMEAELEEVLAAKDCVSLKSLAVNGDDLIALGMQGRQIGATLQHLLDLVMAGSIRNEKRELLAEATWHASPDHMPE